MAELKYTGIFSPGDHVIVTEDPRDGSWEGEECIVILTYRQKGGVFAPERNVEIVVPFGEIEDAAETDEGLAALARQYHDGDLYALSSDEFGFEAV